MIDEIYECDECRDRFLTFTIDPLDEWDFHHIISLDGELCKGCLYKLLMQYYREKVWKIKDLIEGW